MHRYLYAYGNPTVWIDLFGYCTIDPETGKYLPCMSAIKGNKYRGAVKVFINNITFGMGYGEDYPIGSGGRQLGLDASIQSQADMEAFRETPGVKEVETVLMVRNIAKGGKKLITSYKDWRKKRKADILDDKPRADDKPHTDETTQSAKDSDKPEITTEETRGRTGGTDKEPLEKYKVEDYKGSKKKAGDGSVHRDHQPSKAALKRRAEEIKGDRLTPEESRRIEENAKTVTVQDDVHRAGPTYGGKNTPERIDADACDLAGAACRDADDMVENVRRLDSDNVEAAQEAADDIKSMTNDDYDNWIRTQIDDD